MIRQDHLAMLRYFHEEKGDMTRYVEYKELLPALMNEFPHIMEAKQRLAIAERTLDTLIRAEWPSEVE